MHWLMGVILAASPQVSAASRPVDTPPATQPFTARSLIDRLADPDPRQREDAANRIVALGASARPDVLAAWRSGDPRVAPRAGMLLLQLPWSIPDDPPPVQQVLAGYGQREEQQRREIAIKLAEIPGGGPALVRLLQEDPSDTVAWTVYALTARLADDAADARLREIDPAANERVPALAAVGRAWLTADWKKGISILARTIEVQEARPGQDFGLMNFAFDLLAGDAVEHRRFDEAAQWRRRQATRLSGSDPGSASAVLELFALHADFGPLAGFDSDLETFEEDLGRPEVIYALARVYERAGESLVAIAYQQMAARSIGLRQPIVDRNPLLDEPFAAGVWLAEHGWTDEARREFMALLELGHAIAPQGKRMLDSITLSRLGFIAAEGDDDAAAAEFFQRALECSDAGDDGAMTSTIARHRLQAARRANDVVAATKQLDLLLAQAADMELDAAIDVIAYLRELGRKDQATSVFNQVYERQKARPAPSVATQLNNLAWLCARCGERLPEALELSKRANRLEPENAGYWDTAAEANFAAGNPTEAVMLESRALGLKPNDRFMTRQLERFKQGANQ